MSRMHWKTFASDLEDVVKTAKRVGGDLGKEEELFMQYMFMQKNQHRRGVYYHRLRHVEKYVRKQSLESLNVFIGDTDDIVSRYLSGDLLIESFYSHLSQFIEIYGDIVKSIDIIVHAAQFIADMLKRGFFVSFVMTMLAFLSRIRSLRLILAESMRGVVDQIQFLKEMDNSRGQDDVFSAADGNSPCVGCKTVQSDSSDDDEPKDRAISVDSDDMDDIFSAIS